MPQQAQRADDPIIQDGDQVGGTGIDSSSSSSRGTPCSSTNTSKRSSQCAPHEIGAELDLDDPFARHLVSLVMIANRKRKS